MLKRKTHANYMGTTPVVTDDTTNKGPRPRGPAEARREGGGILRVFSFHVDLLDTANKRCLLRENKLEGVKVIH